MGKRKKRITVYVCEVCGANSEFSDLRKRRLKKGGEWIYGCRECGAQNSAEKWQKFKVSVN